MKGNIEGTIEDCELRVQPTRGAYVKYLGISGFSATVKKEKGGMPFYPVAVELAEIRKGVLTYRGQKYSVREIRVSNFNTGKTLEFSIDGGIEGLGNIRTKGEGIFGEKRSDIKGEYSLSKVNMARVFKDYEGLADSRGTFTYRDERLSMNGGVEAPYFSLMEKFLKKPIVSRNNTCHIHLVRVGEITHVVLTGLSYKATPVSLKFTSNQRKLVHLELNTGFVDIPDLVEYIDLNKFSEKDWGPLSLIKDGEVRIVRFIYEDHKPLQAQMDLRGVEAGTGTFVFRNVEGSLQISHPVLNLSNFSGSFGTGRVYDISGSVPLKLNRDVDIRGKYSLCLKDLERLAATEKIALVSGTTEGAIEVHGRKDRGFSVEGAGTVRDGQFVWNRVPLGASGNYTFQNTSFAFDPLRITSEGTEVLVRGTAGRDLTSLKVKGVVGARDIAKLLPRRDWGLNGSVGVDGRVEVQSGSFMASGLVGMTDLAFQVPRYVRKDRGVTSSAVVSLRREENGEVIVDDLSYRLGALSVRASGKAGKRKISDLKLIVNAPEIDKLSNIFFFSDANPRGSLKADVEAKEIIYPLKKLPVMKGFVTVRNGSLHVPALTKPFQNIDLVSKFEGERFAIDVRGLQVGESFLRGARLLIDGIDAPVFNLAAEFDRFNPDDFGKRQKKRFTVPFIDEESLMARTSGTFVIKVKGLQAKGITARDALVAGDFGNRTLVLTEAKAVTNDGDLNLRGSARLTSPAEIDVAAKLRNVTAREVLSLLQARADVLEGAGSIDMSVKSSGSNSEELLSHASGTISVLSRDGVIRKWNILSKILALLNVYDLFRGRVDLTREGFHYRRLSGTFDGREGVFRTDNFLIDSPAMIITGQGDIDLARSRIDGKMTASPLVTMDKLIDWIPLLRSIVKERKTGLLFFVYDVKGPIKDPEITSSYIQSMGTRAFYILRNIFMLPKEVFDQLPKEFPEK
ncbi:MAG: hypothetical protein A4E57_04795 [Syntrophorhabdaceae bacterium PtaU1.Bin034]|nr:MAG: hypothetical protein A4E57_04795 [Syntrophorhabdaceae bacterium PtaU1.Bin034]